MWQLLLHLNFPVFFATLFIFATVAFSGAILKNRSPHLIKKIFPVVLAVSTVIYFAILIEPVNGWKAGGRGNVSISITPFGFLSGDHITENSLHWEEWTLNVLLFVPLGIIAALVFSSRWTLWLFGPALSLTIEVAQGALATGRQSALDDLLANSLGYIIGAGLVLLTGHVLKPRDHPKHATA